MRSHAPYPNTNRRLIALLLVSMASASYAMDYSAGATLDTEVGHNDNIRLVEHDKTSVTKYQLSPVLTLKGRSETTTLELNSTLDFIRYDKSGFNSDDQTILLGLSHELENSSMGINAVLIRNSTITSELLTSGVIGNKAERTEQYRVSPNFAYSLNETNLLQLSASYTAQDYRSTSYTGYKNIGGELDWVHIINERMKLIVAATYSDFHSDDIEYDVPGSSFSATQLVDATTVPPTIRQVEFPEGFFGKQSYYTRTKDKGVQIGLDYQWTESSLLQARLGRSNTTTSYPLTSEQNFCIDATYLGLLAGGYPVGGNCNIPSSSDHLSTAQLNWTWSNETQQFGLTSSKSTQPSGNGYTVDAVQVASNWNYRLTEKDQISANIAVTRNRALNVKNSLLNTEIADRDYRSATLGYRRQINQDWVVNASYQFNYQQYNDIDSRANSKVFAIGVQYLPQAWHWSR